MTSIHLYPKPPYDFALTARSIRAYDTLSVWRGGTLRRALRFGSSIALIAVRSLGTTAAPHLLANILHIQGEATALEAELRHWLAVDVDLRAFYQAAQDDARLAHIVAHLHGLHMLRTTTVFEALAVTLIEQQISLNAAQKAERWAAETYGDFIDYDGEQFYLFPTAAQMAARSVADLTPLKITFERMRRLIALAQAQVEDRLPLEAMRHLPRSETYRLLLAQHGVGHWTAAWTMIRAFGEFQYVGSADVALRAAVNHFWHGLPGRATRADTDALFATHGEFAGWSSVYALMAWEAYRYPRSD